MKIFDMHVHAHASNTAVEPEKLLSQLEKAGVWGCAVISNRPTEMSIQRGTDFDARLNEVLSLTKGYEDRLVPILWVHPFEENVHKKIEIAADAGIAAFKVMCSNYYVGENKSMDMLEKIAAVGKPVIFHTGILWDDGPSANYCRPANWEALLELKGIKFSLAHCAWPWTDECIAVYGKFRNAMTRWGKDVEMFIDITPGTPEIYREELIKKLFGVGYDLPNNMMFGTDCSAENYNIQHAKNWLAIDNALFDKLEVPEKIREKIYYKNFMRFLGRESGQVE